MQQQRTEFAQALRAVAQERKLDPEVIIESIKQSIIAAYKRDAREQGMDELEMEALSYDVILDPGSGETQIFAFNPETPEDRKEVTPPGFGRIAAQTAKQVIHQKIREAEKGVIMEEFSGRVGSLITGIVLRFDGPDVRVDLGRTEALMPADERIPSERLNLSQRLTFLVKEIKETVKGKLIVLSRSDPNFVIELFKREVPEMSAGSVVVKAIARESGVRTKMAVFSEQSGVDPVGSCVGQKGVRVQAVTNELGGERVDIIQYTDNMEELVKASLSPAENATVNLDKETNTAHVTVSEDQLSLAIGKDGQNARLAAKLTGWKIKIVGDGVKTESDTQQETGDKLEENNEQKTENKEEETPETKLDEAEKKDAQVQDQPADDTATQVTDDTADSTPQESSEEPAVADATDVIAEATEVVEEKAA
jgi:transcription termination/antitermination protein NusA